MVLNGVLQSDAIDADKSDFGISMPNTATCTLKSVPVLMEFFTKETQKALSTRAGLATKAFKLYHQAAHIRISGQYRSERARLMR